jgi:NAD(P)-dependent dehydrogenase (short-subunit alcohol dehydrogenase family)
MSTFLVTGATDGIGFATAKALLKRGDTVLVHGRTAKKAEGAVATLGKGAAPVWGDLSDLRQVRALADQCSKPLDGVIHNAGVFETERHESAQGHELTMAVNHLAPFLLTKLLLQVLKDGPQGRIVNVSSMAHARGRLDLNDFDFRRGFDGYAVYAASKLANIYFTHALARRLQGSRVTTYALHPGVIATKLLKKGFSMAGAPVPQGAETSVYCATAPELAKVSGRYYSDAHEAACAPHANDEKLEEALWALSEKLTSAVE